MDKVPQCARERSESRIMTFIIQWATYDGATALVGCQKKKDLSDEHFATRIEYASQCDIPFGVLKNHIKL